MAYRIKTVEKFLSVVKNDDYLVAGDASDGGIDVGCIEDCSEDFGLPPMTIARIGWEFCLESVLVDLSPDQKYHGSLEYDDKSGSRDVHMLASVLPCDLYSRREDALADAQDEIDRHNAK